MIIKYHIIIFKKHVDYSKKRGIVINISGCKKKKELKEDIKITC